ncbi:hypothetical protein ACFQX7_28530 [Luedemannella flava]
MTIREAYLRAARSAAELLADPAVAAAWDEPSALAEFRVSGLAGHLGRQVNRVVELAAAGPSAEAPITLLDHFERSTWVGAQPDDPVSVGVRESGRRTRRAARRLSPSSSPGRSRPSTRRSRRCRRIWSWRCPGPGGRSPSTTSSSPGCWRSRCTTTTSR